MNRRALLASVGATISGVFALVFSMGEKLNSSDSDQVALEYVFIKNSSDEVNHFNLTVVREAEIVYQGQLELQPGESTRVDGWQLKGRSFTVFGMSKTFSNYEVGTIDYAGFDRSYRGEFEIEPSGDVRGGIANVEEAEDGKPP